MIKYGWLLLYIYTQYVPNANNQSDALFSRAGRKKSRSKRIYLKENKCI